MDKEKVYAYVEEAEKRETMKLLDAVINRFRELYDDRELIVISLEKGESGKCELDRIVEMLKCNI